jgi:hypothetical protein
MILGVSNVGTIPSIAEEWNCYFEFMDGQGNLRRILGQARAVPDDLVLNRRNGEPLQFGRNDAIYVKAMNSPIAAGAKVVGVLVYRFPKDTVTIVKADPNSSIWVTFQDVFGQKYSTRRPVFGGAPDPQSEWIDMPGMDRPLTQPPPKK